MVLAPVPWRAVFGNDRPVEVEIGFGKGAVILALARNNPERNFFGIESAARRVQLVAARARRQGLVNVRLLHADAACVVRHLIPPDSVSAYHVYFPDPWPKRRHHRRRLFAQPGVPAALARTLRPEGMIALASDVPEHLAEMAAALAAVPLLRRLEAAPQRPAATHFEVKYLRAGRSIGAAAFVKTCGGDTGGLRPAW